MAAIRQNFSDYAVKAINHQINLELHASYTYTAMWAYFSRHDVALPGYTKLFAKLSDNERQQAYSLMRYQNERGGKVVFPAVGPVSRTEFTTGLDALAEALELSRKINESVFDMKKCGDEHLNHFLEEHFSSERVKVIYRLAQYITQQERLGTGPGEFTFDKMLEEEDDA